MDAITHHAAPNVVPGTNFDTHRFKELYAWITAQTNDAARSIRLPFHYGLLTAFDGKRSLLLEKVESHITLRRCAGITPAGQVVGIFEGITPVIETNLEQYQLDKKSRYQLLVEVDEDTRTPFGPVSEDLPQRPLFTMASYKLHVQSIDQKLGYYPNAFPIGLLIYEAGEWLLADYLPPCAHVGAHERLEEKYRAYQEAIKTMLRTQPNIIRQTDSFRDKAMIELREFTLQCGSFLSTQSASIFSLTTLGHPYLLIDLWVAYAQLMDFLLHCLTDRPGFYNLLYLNTRSVNGIMLTTERLDNVLFDLTNHQYDHCNAMASIKAIDQFLELIVPMFKALGNGTLRPTGNKYEEVYKAPPSEPKTSHVTW